VACFEAERQALALIDHSNIAKIHIVKIARRFNVGWSGSKTTESRSPGGTKEDQV